MNKKQTTWGNVAEWYDEMLENNEGTYQKEVILPNMLRLLSPMKGLIIADVACGQGYFSREFAKAGAKVIASDISPELVKIAKGKESVKVGGKEKEKEKAEKSQLVEYHVSPADDLTFIKSQSVDKVTIILAIQNIENAQKVWGEAYRVLKPGGELHLVLNHPAFRIPKASFWGFDEKEKEKMKTAGKLSAPGKSPDAGPAGVQYRRIDAYMNERKEKIDMAPGSKKGGDEKENEAKFTYSFHRPLQWYVKTLGNAGFLISRLEEWLSHKVSQPGPRAGTENKIRKEIPLFLYMQAVKK
ncbi:MAG: methyltransferase domain-containing protein [Candidatus Taylorbacteria bacterium]|nr:methyltransferase domain-containing protein [Candidatus Taylorbacteria bacterium]